ncbi:MAG: twin-arginine translocation pathway signal [Balneola sp.]|nr:MAG: twin-arginine translocation pathway signal [Balneola sp.]
MIILYVLGAFLLLFFGIGWWTSAPGYSGPKTDHFNGSKFLNGEGYEAQKFGDIIKWATTRTPGEWTEIGEDEAGYGSKPIANVSDSIQVITFINHSTFLVQTDGLNIITDPVYGKRVSPFSFAGPKRMRPPGIKFEDLPEIHAVLLSHNHYDHLDISTLKRIQQVFDPVFITPLGIDLYLNKNGITNTVPLDWWEGTQLSDSVKVDAVEAQHFSSRGMFDRDKTLWAGFVIQSPKGNIYFAGDTGYNTFFKEIGERYAPIKTSIIPIGAYIPRWIMSPVHVDPQEAIQIHQDVNSELSIAMHFGTFPLADDGYDDPIKQLNELVGDIPFIMLKEGERIVRE